MLSQSLESLHVVLIVLIAKSRSEPSLVMLNDGVGVGKQTVVYVNRFILEKVIILWFFKYLSFF
jgi:hypothetical protein